MSKKEMVSSIADRVIESSRDYPETIDCPDENRDEVVRAFSTRAHRLALNVAKTLKQIGWRVSQGEVDADEQADGGTQNITFEFELSIKGGQQLIIDRKKVVADGLLSPNFFLMVHSEQGEEEEDLVEEEYWSGRHDDYDLSSRSHLVSYTCPSSGIDFFEVEEGSRGSVPKSISRKAYAEKEVERFAHEWTKAFFHVNSRSNWKKRATDRIADTVMAATKGHFIHRSPNPRKQPSTIYISDGRNVIFLETGGRYKGKFVPIDSAKMPPLSEMDSLPVGKTHNGIIIDGNIVSEIASVLRDPSYEVVAPSLGLVRDITYSAPFNPKQEWDMLIGQPLAFGEPTGIPSLDKRAQQKLSVKDVSRAIQEVLSKSGVKSRDLKVAEFPSDGQLRITHRKYGKKIQLIWFKTSGNYRLSIEPEAWGSSLVGEVVKNIRDVKKFITQQTKGHLKDWFRDPHKGPTPKQLIEKARKIIGDSREYAYVEDTGRYDTATIIFNDAGLRWAKKTLAVLLSDFQYEVEDTEVYGDDVSFEVKLISYNG